MDIAIVGAGLIGTRRAEDAMALGHNILWVADSDRERAQQLAEITQARHTIFWHEAIDDPATQVVFASSTNKVNAEVAIAALSREKHVLIEQPMGRNAEEAGRILSAARERGMGLHVGLNFRYYPGIRDARELIDLGRIGRLVYARIHFGHGAHPGYENDWKLDPENCGGGVLMELGAHCIDLFRLFLGELWECNAMLRSDFWKKGIDDNVFLNFSSADGRVGSAHVSLTQWMNTFFLELGGTEGMIRVAGRSGFYGPQHISIIPRWSWMDTPDGNLNIVEKVYPMEDVSFREELKEFFAKLAGNPATVDGYDGFRTTEIIDRIYQTGDGVVTIRPEGKEVVHR